MSDLLLLPHCDLHMALVGTPALKLRVYTRNGPDALTGRYTLKQIFPLVPGDPVVPTTLEFFAPHEDPGMRLSHPPTVGPDGVVTATVAGVYLFQVRIEGHYIVGRLQVHKEIVGWWFGNDSITTACEPGSPGLPGIAHAQPSIYAEFKDDPGPGTDLVGDITGHGYVTLVPGDPAKVEVTPAGRLRGLVETPIPNLDLPDTPTKITGTFLGSSIDLPVRVVDYVKVRNSLFPSRTPDVSNAEDKHNIIFIPEGFRNTKTDKEIFDKVVMQTASEMFEKPRHEPYSMLERGFNIFNAYLPSQQQGVTCGYRVADSGETSGQGQPIPYNGSISRNRLIYTMQELVVRVGLPKRGENRPDLPGLWARQSLADFKRAKVDNALVEAWKVHQSAGILHARDTVFGMQLGRRLADRRSIATNAKVERPANDATTDVKLEPFVARLYEFYNTPNTRRLSLDQRRHPPELFEGEGFTNPGNSILRYIGALHYARTPFPALGDLWQPDITKFKRSRGLIALVVHDDVIGGSNLNGRTITAQTMNHRPAVSFRYGDGDGSANKRKMRRDLSAMELKFDAITDVVAHEFGHSFNLSDEYEEHGGDDKKAESTCDSIGDNVSVLGFLRTGGVGSRKIDMFKVKWFELLRMRISARLLEPSREVTGGILVTVDRRYIDKWVKAKAESAKVHLRNFHTLSTSGQQLPLSTAADQYIEDLTIGDIKPAAGTFVLTKQGLPSSPNREFKRGSAVFVPLRHKSGGLAFVVEQNVLTHLRTHQDPLNQVTDITVANPDKDVPVPIIGFTPPCVPATLIGIYEGADHSAGGHYRPAGQCKMRNQFAPEEGGMFCYVCKWLIVNRVDPSYHAMISEKFYPGAKKNDD